MADTLRWKSWAWAVALFLLLYHLPLGNIRFDHALQEGFLLVKWYAREHVLLCLVPAFILSGAIQVFIRGESVMRHLGPGAPKVKAYGVASVAGSVLAVCSCTVLPLFAGIYRMGAGLGPASAFLYSGPAINVLAVVLTARILGAPLGIARAFGAVFLAVVIGLLMHMTFRHEPATKVPQAATPDSGPGRPLFHTVSLVGSLAAILVFANWGASGDGGLWDAVHGLKWPLTVLFYLLLNFSLVRLFGFSRGRIIVSSALVLFSAVLWPSQPLVAFGIGTVGFVWTLLQNGEEGVPWLEATSELGLQILPLLLGGVFIAGVLLGRPGEEGIVPSAWIASWVGGNGLFANFFSSVVAALMYFATLTEVPILQGLLGNGMGQGPALALLLAGPALSLPSILVIKSVMGWKRTLVYVGYVVLFSTLAGWAFGFFQG